VTWELWADDVSNPVQGRPIVVGDVLVTFRGDPVAVVGLYPPRHSGSSGHVHVMGAGGVVDRFYAGVVHARFVRQDKVDGE
jgi:hypothetical protein